MPDTSSDANGGKGGPQLNGYRYSRRLLRRLLIKHVAPNLNGFGFKGNER